MFTASQSVSVSNHYQTYLSNYYQSYPKAGALEKPVRRRFTAEYKLRILREADTCTRRGEIGALLDREKLSFSNLTAWRRQWEQGQLQALTDNKRGRKAKTSDSLQTENQRLMQENQRLAKRLKETELMLDIQKKASKILLGVSLSRARSDESS